MTGRRAKRRFFVGLYKFVLRWKGTFNIMRNAVVQTRKVEGWKCCRWREMMNNHLSGRVCKGSQIVGFVDALVDYYKSIRERQRFMYMCTCAGKFFKYRDRVVMQAD